MLGHVLYGLTCGCRPGQVREGGRRGGEGEGGRGGRRGKEERREGRRGKEEKGREGGKHVLYSLTCGCRSGR
jgi:hypothetical protein